MEKDSASSDPLAELDAAWKIEKRPLQTKARWGSPNDPTAGDVFRLTLGGIGFFLLAIAYLAYALKFRSDAIAIESLYVIGFCGVSFAFFRLAVGVKKRLKLFRIAKADYLEKRGRLEAMLNR